MCFCHPKEQLRKEKEEEELPDPKVETIMVADTERL